VSVYECVYRKTPPLYFLMSYVPEFWIISKYLSPAARVTGICEPQRDLIQYYKILYFAGSLMSFVCCVFIALHFLFGLYTTIII